MKIKRKELISTLFLALLLTFAIIVDYLFVRTSHRAGTTFDFYSVSLFVEWRSIIRILFYFGFFILIQNRITNDHKAGWPMVIIGASTLLITNLMPGRRLDILRNFYQDIEFINASIFGLTEHYAALLVAFGSVQIFKNRIQKK